MKIVLITTFNSIILTFKSLRKNLLEWKVCCWQRMKLVMISCQANIFDKEDMSKEDIGKEWVESGLKPVSVIHC